MIYNVVIDTNKGNIAGTKAPADIAAICRKLQFTAFEIPPNPMTNKKGLLPRLQLMLIVACNIIRMFFTFREGDTVIFQHPNYGVRPLMKAIPKIRRRRKCSFVVLIHDLESLRKSVDWSDQKGENRGQIADHEFLKTFDHVISHNRHMTEHLTKVVGIPAERIVDLGIFDYLSDTQRVQPPKGEVPSVAIAGALAKWKCGYLYEMPADPAELTVHLYGNNFDQENANPNMVYHGSFKPDLLPEHLVGDFGLVWDGDTADTCACSLGNYLRYNNPHKTSLYLSSNMPVAVWEEAAIADFVRENRVGITVRSLHELPDAIRAVSAEEYREICENVKRIGKKLRAGDYFSAAIETCLEEKR